MLHHSLPELHLVRHADRLHELEVCEGVGGDEIGDASAVDGDPVDVRPVDVVHTARHTGVRSAAEVKHGGPRAV